MMSYLQNIGQGHVFGNMNWMEIVTFATVTHAKTKLGV